MITGRSLRRRYARFCLNAPPNFSGHAMTHSPAFKHILRFSDLSGRAPTLFDLKPEPDVLAHIAQDLDVLQITKLRFWGDIRPIERHDWQLRATLQASVVQSCVVSLAPVTTKLSEKITRTYLAHMHQTQEPEAEMPEDDSQEPLPTALDLIAVLSEALALALPLYPRANDATLNAARTKSALSSEADATPAPTATVKPFAALAALHQTPAADHAAAGNSASAAAPPKSDPTKH
jgi:uncharacterized metal-binding protein YceD (DUF177 family)